MSTKFIYYIEGVSRNIVITDQDETEISLDELAARASSIMAGDRISKFQTDKDVLVVRPNEIKAIHITRDHTNNSNMIDNKSLQEFIPDIEFDDMNDKSSNDILDQEVIIDDESIDQKKSEEKSDAKITDNTD